MHSITDSCDLIIFNNSLIEHWNDTLEIQFNNIISQDFYYQCNTNNILNKTEINCYYENSQYFLEKGLYIFNSSKPLGNNNIFNLDVNSKE